MKDLNISSIKAAGIGAATGTAFGLFSFLFVTYRHPKGMGSVLFLVVPVVAGFSIALVARGRNSAAAASLLAVLATLAILVGLGKEGLLCAALAFPVLAAGLFFGLGLGLLFRRIVLDRSRNQITTTGIFLLTGPMLIFAGERLERPIIDHGRTELVSTTVQIKDSPDHVWPHIQSIDSIGAPKPFLMYIGLPVPQRCTIQGHGIGARRTCYFNSGYIQETVTAWNPPYLMGLAVDRMHMPGRHWLSFENAEYRLETDGQTTTLVRSTTFTSRLHPGWYWRGFERLGVESEHRYILRDLRAKAESSMPPR